MEEFNHKIELLKMSLEVSVPFLINDIRNSGGPTPNQIKEASNIGLLIAEKGDQLMFKTKNTVDIFNKLAYAVAIASFMPGGINIFGLHYETKLEVLEPND